MFLRQHDRQRLSLCPASFLYLACRGVGHWLRWYLVRTPSVEKRKPVAIRFQHTVMRLLRSGSLWGRTVVSRRPPGLCRIGWLDRVRPLPSRSECRKDAVGMTWLYTAKWQQASLNSGLYGRVHARISGFLSFFQDRFRTVPLVLRHPRQRETSHPGESMKSLFLLIVSLAPAVLSAQQCVNRTRS